jgi:hypothetical protein
MQDHVVPDGDVVADDERMRVVCDMQHAEVLHVRAVPDANVVHIAANDGMKPGAALFAHHDVADDHGGLFDKAGLRDSRGDALKRADHTLNLG